MIGRLGAFDYRDGYGNCPPGYYRPAPMYDCRPQVSGQVYQMENSRAVAAQYVDDRPYEGGTGASTGTPPLNYYQQQPPAGVTAISPTMPAVSSASGDNTMLLILAAVALFFVMKK
jgi:hypothetical protein